MDINYGRLAVLDIWVFELQAGEESVEDWGWWGYQRED
jgi:hypothetical protein